MIATPEARRMDVGHIPIVDPSGVVSTDPGERRAEEMFAQAARFSALSKRIKRCVGVMESASYRGCTQLFGENSDPSGSGDVHESFDIAAHDPPMNRWPLELNGFRPVLGRYLDARRSLDEGFSAALRWYRV